MISSADRTPPYAEEIPVSMMMIDALQRSTIRSKFGVCPCCCQRTSFSMSTVNLHR